MQKKMKDFKKENAGRSMTEMLGVLAIIGVLSLGGIIGYKLAMNRYAANQIAYEINMMKTDAKVKIMQGNDTLTLGQPYDGGTIRFGDYGTTFGCSFVQDEDAENIVVGPAETCQVANAYYIELKNIPEGICKPLANLIENMNDLIAFDINLTESEEGRVGGDCQGDNNTLNAVFSAEPGDLEVLKCDSEKDCSGGLKCHNHLCVECTEDTDCGKTGYCENNACEYCESGVWDSATKQCVDCLEKTDCKDNPKGEICNTTEKKCVECLNYTDCTDPEKPVCNDNNMCEACPDDTYFSETGCTDCKNVTCSTNMDCCENYYCHKLERGVNIDGLTGSCQKITGNSNGEFFMAENCGLNQYNACRLCEAHAKASGESCGNNSYESLYQASYSMLQCTYTVIGYTKHYYPMEGRYCYNSQSVLSDKIKDLKELAGCNRESTSCSNFFWLRDNYSLNRKVCLSLGDGIIYSADALTNVDDGQQQKQYFGRVLCVDQ